MKHIKLFNEMKISHLDFPMFGHGNSLTKKESDIIKGAVGDYIDNFTIKVDDGYYYTSRFWSYNRFEKLSELIEYLSICYYLDENKPEEIIKILKDSKLDPSFDDNIIIDVSSRLNYIELVELLLMDERVDPTDHDNYPLRTSFKYGNYEITKLLINNPKVRNKLTEIQIENYERELERD